jgi:hypothetical protein
MRALVSLSLVAHLLAPVAAYAGSPGNNWPDLSLPAPVQGGGEKDVALIIGISDYSDLADIPGAADNAREWATYLTETRKLDPVNVFTVLDKEAIVETIKLKLENAITATKDGGTLWVIYIGHGYSGEDEDKNKSGLLVGHDARPVLENMKNRSLSQDFLFKQINKGKQLQSVVLLDACFSGKTPAGKDLIDTGLQVAIIADDPDDVIKRQVAPKKQKGLVVLTATDKNEYAGPLPGTKKPAFSYLILGAMRGWASNGDGSVTADEALSYSSEILRQAADRKQSPQLKGKTKGSFVLSKGNEPKPSPSFNPLVEEVVTPLAAPNTIEKVKIKISSNPNGSTIFVNNLSYALTPAELEFPKSAESKMIRVARDGYEPQELAIVLNESQEKSFTLKELPPPIIKGPDDLPKANNRALYSGVLGAGAVGSGVASIFLAKGFCDKGNFGGGKSGAMYSLPAISGVLGGSAWMAFSATKEDLLAPSLGATGALLLLSGVEYATYKCPEPPPPAQGQQPKTRNTTNDPLLAVGLGLMGAAVVDFAVWGIIYAKHKKQPEKPTQTTFNFSPLTNGAMLQLRTNW